jgi:hypothetical protein
LPPSATTSSSRYPSSSLSHPNPHPRKSWRPASLDSQCVSQAASRGAATDEWPYAVHLLAHLYLNDLYAIRRPLALVFSHPIQRLGLGLCY